MEIITGVERRRRWQREDKLRIVAEAEQPGACFAEVARRHDVSRALLWTWRRQVRESRRRSSGAESFLPVQVVEESPAAVGVVACAEPVAGRSRRSPRRPAGAEAGLIEIALPDGTAVRVPETIGAPALRRVLAALRG